MQAASNRHKATSKQAQVDNKYTQGKTYTQWMNL